MCFCDSGSYLCSSWYIYALTLGVNKGLGSGLKYLSKTLFKQYWKEYILDSAQIAGVTIGIDLLNTLVEYIKELLI